MTIAYNQRVVGEAMLGVLESQDRENQPCDGSSGCFFVALTAFIASSQAGRHFHREWRNEYGGKGVASFHGICSLRSLGVIAEQLHEHDCTEAA